MNYQRLRQRLLPLLLLVVAALSASSVVGVSAASADRQLCTLSGAGCVQFDGADNRFYVCDRAADGYSVVARYRRTNELYEHLLINYWGSAAYNGCHRFDPISPNGATSINYTVCLANNAAPSSTKPMVIKEDTCRLPVKHIF